MRKFYLRTLFAALCLTAVFTVSAYAENAVVTGSDVNFRSGPGMNFPVTDCLPKGAEVTVTDRSDSSWFGVSYNGQNGYMSSMYLSITEVNETPAVSETGNGFINAMYVRFRSGPSTDYSILGEYNSGTPVNITGSSDGWTAVTINGVAGYVYSSYVTQNGAASAPAETPAAPVETPAAPAETPSAPVETPSAPAETPVQTPGYTVTPVEQAAGTINGDEVRFRTGPSTNDSIINNYSRGKALTITGTCGDWTQVVIDGTTGFVFSQYVSKSEAQAPAPEQTPEQTPTDTKLAYIKGNTVNFRSGPSTSTEILGTYNYGTEITVTGVSGEWTAATINGTAGYVFSQYVTDTKLTVSPTGSATGQQIAEFALQFVGYNYAWGCESPEEGFDCSGLVYYVYKQFGYTMNRVACDQALNGVHVEPNDLQPGDVLCFYSSSDYIGHAGIYIGDGKFVHASTYTTGVIVSELTSGSYSIRGFEARRIVT